MRECVSECAILLLHCSNGSKSGSSSSCRKCQGTGVQLITRQLGRGMLQQMQSICRDCNGSGEWGELMGEAGN